jgi:hypothetical protein
MASPLLEFVGLITGSGAVGAGVTFFASRKTQKTDLSQKTIDFWEKKADDYLSRLGALDERLKNLEDLKCEKEDCPNRI